MANDHNQCSFIGRLGRDVEIRHAADGTAVANFTIACGWKTKDKEGAEWVRIVAFGKLAEICGEYLSKGKQVFVSGRFRTREYEKDGEKRYVSEIVADKMQMLGGREDGGQTEQRSAPASRPAPQRPASNEYAEQSRGSSLPPTNGQSLADLDDDLPF